jgi:single-strand DNA-binding protein
VFVYNLLYAKPKDTFEFSTLSLTFASNKKNMSYELKGKLHKIFPIEKKTDTFQTREMVVETTENYPQLIKFQLVQENCAVLDTLQEGMEINVKFDLRGREWNGKYFTNLQAWKVDATNNENMPGTSATFPPDGMGADIDMSPDDDLPF